MSKPLMQGFHPESGLTVCDPGHTYMLQTLDGWRPVILPFVKREGPNFPGNTGTQTGTTTQAVLRALIDRTKYVDNQIHDDRNQVAIQAMRTAILAFEERAAERHGCTVKGVPEEIELCPVGMNGHMTDYWVEVE